MIGGEERAEIIRVVEIAAILVVGAFLMVTVSHVIPEVLGNIRAYHIQVVAHSSSPSMIPCPAINARVFKSVSTGWLSMLDSESKPRPFCLNTTNQ